MRLSDFRNNLVPSVQPDDVLPLLQGTENYGVTVEQLTGQPSLGWNLLTDTWAFSSMNYNTRVGVMTIPAGGSARYQEGMYIRYVQSGVTNYAVITSVADTALTLYVDINSDLLAVSVTSPAYSNTKAPFGLPIALQVRGKEIARFLLLVNGDTMNLSFPARQNLRVRFGLLNSGTINCRLNFNNDATAQYSQLFSNSFAAPGSSTVNQAFIDFDNGSPTNPVFATMDVLNISNQEKHAILNSVWSGGTAGNFPAGLQIYGKYSVTTGPITSIQITNVGAGDLAAGSYIYVEGWD